MLKYLSQSNVIVSRGTYQSRICPNVNNWKYIGRFIISIKFENNDGSGNIDGSVIAANPKKEVDS